MLTNAKKGQLVAMKWQLVLTEIPVLNASVIQVTKAMVILVRTSTNVLDAVAVIVMLSVKILKDRVETCLKYI